MPRWFPALAYALVACAPIAVAQPLLPPARANVRAFPGSDLDGASRSRAIAAHPNGRIYAGNDNGLREYDGARWRVVAGVGERIIYAVAIDTRGRVWFAAADRIGFAEPDASGALAVTFVDVALPAAERAAKGAQVRRRIVARGEDVYVLLGASGTVVRIDAKRAPHPMAIGSECFSLNALDGSIVVQAANGAWRIADDAVEPFAPVTPAFGQASRAILSAWPRADGRTWLVTSAGLRLWRADGKTDESETARDFAAAERFVAGCPLGDDWFVLGTATAGIAIAKTNGDVTARYDARTLGSDLVNDVAVDRDGAIWVALERGVACVTRARDAGEPIALSAPRPPRDTGLPLIRTFSDAVNVGRAENRALLVTRDGLVYVGNRTGLYEFDGVSWRWIPGSEVVAVYALAQDTAGRVWFAGDRFGVLVPDANGQLRVDFREGQLSPADRDFGTLFRALRHGDDVYFLGQARGVVLRIDAQQRLHLLRAGESLSSLFVLDGVVRAQGQTRCFIVHPDRIEAAEPRESELLNSYALGFVRATRPRPDGGTTLATTRGLRTWAQGRLERASGDIDRARVRSTIVDAVVLDDDRIALGTDASGVLIADRDGTVLTSYDEERGLAEGGAITALAVDAEGGLWVAHRAGLFRLQVKSPLRQHGAGLGLRGAVRDVVVHRGRVYVATTHGVFVRDPVSGRFAPFATAVDAQALVSTEEGLLMAAVALRLARDDGSVELIDNPGWVYTDLLRLPRDPGRIVANSTRGLRVFRREAGTWRVEGDVSAARDALSRLQQDAAGWLWGVHDSQKVVRLDWRQGVRLDAPLETLGVAQGLPDLEPLKVFAGLVLLGGDVAMSSRAGLFRYDRALDRFVPETRIAGLNSVLATRDLTALSDGSIWMQDTRGERNALLRPSGPGAWRLELEPYTGIETTASEVVSEDPGSRTLWLGGASLASYDLGAPRTIPPLPAARVRRVVLGEGALLWGGAGAMPAGALAAHQNSLRFDYAAPSYVADATGAVPTQYRTRLDGFDREWSAWTNDARRTYTNLPPGRFAFRVQARTTVGREGPEASYAFRVLPPWWRTWWFLGLASLTGIGSVAGITRWFANRALKRRVELLEAQSAVERERLRLARDLHDEVGSGLGRVILFAGEADRTAGDPQKQRAALDRVRAAAQDLVQHAREIVWAVSPQHDTLASVIERLGDYAEETLRSAGIACAVERPSAEKIPPVTLGSEARHSLFLAVKEAVHNAVKYSEAKTAKFRLEISGNDFVITLRDHGRGFAPGEKRGSGHGTKNIIARAEALGGRAEIASDVGKGTTVTLRVPLTPRERGDSVR